MRCIWFVKINLIKWWWLWWWWWWDIPYLCAPIYTLVPEVFLDFSPHKTKRAIKLWIQVTKRRERKTSGYFGLESHFYTDARVRIWPSSSDWLIFLNTQINMIGPFDWQYWGAVGYLSLHLFLPEFDFLSDSVFEALLAVINCKDVFAILPTGHGIPLDNSVDPWCQQIPVPCRLFIPSPSHNFGWVSSEISGGLSYLQIAKPWHFSDQFQHWRYWPAQSAKRSLCLSIRKSQGLITMREVEKLNLFHNNV